MFSCEFCEIFKNTFFYRTPPVAPSANSHLPHSKQVALLDAGFFIVVYQLNLFIRDVSHLYGFYHG